MNLSIFIFPNISNLYNYNDSKKLKFIYIISDFFNDQEWKKYITYKNVTYESIVNHLIEKSLLSNILYTYMITHNNKFELSPYYIESMYKNFDINEYKKLSKCKHTIYKIKSSKFLKKYIEVLNIGRLKECDEKYNKCTTYKLTDLGIKLVKKIEDSNSIFHKIDINYFNDKCGIIHKDEIKRFKCENKFFTKFNDAKLYAKKNKLNVEKFTYIESIINEIIVGNYNFEEIHNQNDYNFLNEFKTHPIVKENNVIINKNDIYSIINDEKLLKKCNYCMIKELFFMYNNCDNDVLNYKIKYYQTNEGRYYAQNSFIQMFPKEVRNKILSNYIEVDMECSVYTIYYNLIKLFHIDGEFKEINSIISDKKKYRNKFVTENISYECVKTLLTSIAYGAKLDICNMHKIIEYGYGFYKSSILELENVSKESIFDFCCKSEIQDLYNEINLISKSILPYFISEKYIINIFGNKLKIERGLTKGKKLAHIYQSYEAKILDVATSTMINNKRLCDIKNSIGLYLHDGFYINKDIIEKYSISVIDLIIDNIKNKLDFDVKYELK